MKSTIAKANINRATFDRVILERSDAHPDRRVLSELRTDGRNYAYFEKHGAALTDAYAHEQEALKEYETLTVACASCLAPHLDRAEWRKI